MSHGSGCRCRHSAPRQLTEDGFHPEAFRLGCGKYLYQEDHYMINHVAGKVKKVDSKTETWWKTVLDQNGVTQSWQALSPPTLIEYATRPISAIGTTGERLGTQIVGLTGHGPDLSKHEGGQCGLLLAERFPGADLGIAPGRRLVGVAVCE